MMWLLVGLGNPGDRYQGTRHNVGFDALDALASRMGVSFSDRKFKGRCVRGRLGNTDCILLKPETFMNLSGESVGPALGFYKLSTAQVVVLHDELDLELGRVKLKVGGGHGGHNGLRSLIQHLPDANFARIRMGIGRPPPAMDPANFVLSTFRGDERAAAEKLVDNAVGALESVLKEGVTKAMNVINRGPEASERGSRTQKKPDTADT